MRLELYFSLYNIVKVHGKTTHGWHTDDIRVHTSEVRVHTDDITSKYEWHRDDMRVIYEYTPLTCERQEILNCTTDLPNGFPLHTYFVFVCFPFHFDYRHTWMSPTAFFEKPLSLKRRFPAFYYRTSSCYHPFFFIRTLKTTEK